VTGRRDLVLADATRQAVALAAMGPPSWLASGVVYLVGDQVLVRRLADDVPPGAAVHLVAERWDDDLVQVRTASEFPQWVRLDLVGGAA